MDTVECECEMYKCSDNETRGGISRGGRDQEVEGVSIVGIRIT